MLVREFRTDDFPQAERFGLWHDMATEAFIPSVLRSDHDTDFRASARLVDLGAVRVFALTNPPLESVRTRRLIRRSDPEYYQVMLTLRGNHRFVQGRREAVTSPGDMLLYDPSQPWNIWSHADTHTAECVQVRLPRALLPIPASTVAQLTTVRLPGSDGMGTLVSGFLTNLITGASEYRPTDSGRLATLTVDLLTTRCARHLDAEAQIPPDTRQRVLQRRIDDFIERNLSDPGLSPADIAAAHHISLRSLHRLFHDHDTTVATRIRQRRLEHCRRDLANPHLRSHPIHAIATRWGFTDPAHFSRAFRDAYGTPPSDYRTLALPAATDGTHRQPPGTEGQRQTTTPPPHWEQRTDGGEWRR